MQLKYFGILGAAVTLFAAASVAEPIPSPNLEHAQLPPPFGRPGPIVPGPQSCSPHYQRLLKLQAEGMRQLQRLSRGEGEKLCATLETTDLQGVDKLIDPKTLERLLTPDQRDLLGSLGIDLSKVNVGKLMQRLGIDPSQVDLRNLKQQCRQSQGDIDRFTANELARLEGEIMRCDDRI